MREIKGFVAALISPSARVGAPKEQRVPHVVYVVKMNGEEHRCFPRRVAPTQLRNAAHCLPVSGVSDFGSETIPRNAIFAERVSALRQRAIVNFKGESGDF